MTLSIVSKVRIETNSLISLAVLDVFFTVKSFLLPSILGIKRMQSMKPSPFCFLLGSCLWILESNCSACPLHKLF